jgi:peptide/nickel transport system substrate-binding protein
MKSARTILTAFMVAATLLSACGGATPTAAPAPTKAPEATKAPEPTKAPEATATTAPEPTKAPEATAAAEPTKAPEATATTETNASFPTIKSEDTTCKDSTYIGVLAADPASIDASVTTTGEGWGSAQYVYDTLTRYLGTSGKIVPWLATSWDSPDTKVWTFKLREGVKFHDGTEFDADAVKFNFDRWGDKTNAYRFPGQIFEYYENNFGSGASTAIEKTEVVDKYTFRITLKAPSVILPVNLTLLSFSIASPTAIKTQKEKYATPAGTAVGTGRFKLVSWTADEKVTYERNDDWWGGKGDVPYTQLPLLKTVILRVIKDATVQKAEFEAGRVDAISLTAEEVKALADDDPTFAKYPGKAMGIGYVKFNQNIKPWDKIEVRQAIAHGVNWDAIFKAFYKPTDMRAAGFQPPAIPGYNPNLQPYEYNLDKAKELMAKAGLADGFETDFWYIPVVRSYMPEAKALAEAIAAEMANLNIKVNLKTEDWAVYLSDRAAGKFGIWQAGWGSDNGDPDNFISYHWIAKDAGKPNVEDGYYNAKLQELLQAGAGEADPDKRIKIYQDAEQILHDDYPVIPVAWPIDTSIVPRFIKNNLVFVFRDNIEFICVARER